MTSIRTAFLFPGQGAQFAGMGRDFYDRFPEAQDVFDQAAAVLGPDFLEVIFSGPEEKLQQTENTQPAVLTVSIAILRVLEKQGYKAIGLAGLSLGEYSALVAAGTLSFKETLLLVQKRGLYMQEAVPLGQGMMVAIMGLSHDIVEQLCRDARPEGFAAPANYTCPGQIVISGHVPAVKLATDLARKAGAKKITKLKVSAPFHCALLQPVETKLAGELDKIEVKKPSIPVVFNNTAKFSDCPDQIKVNLARQVSSPILWEQSVRALLAAGINSFIGFGPGNSLTRLMKRIAPEIRAVSVETVEAVKQLSEE